MKPLKGTIAAVVKPSAAPKPAAGHPHKNLGGYLHPKGGMKGKC